MTIQLKRLLAAAHLVSLLLLGLLGSAAFASEYSLKIPTQVNKTIELTLDKSDLDLSSIDYSDLLRVYVGSTKDCCANKAPIVGRYESVNKSVKFTPRFDFVEGQDYVVRVLQQSEENGEFIKLTTFNIPSDTPAINAEVTNIYPSGDVLPENLLRFYIHFTTPMKPHVAFKYIKLVDASGNVDDAAFMKFKQELWSEDRKRLTLLMDPGRIKRKVSTNQKLGPALQKGKRYKLIVDNGWPTANGRKYLTSFSKSFLVTDALRELPNTENWETAIPAIRTKDTFVIKFDRPFDHQLLHKDIQVLSATGQRIQGQPIIGSDETEWSFQPNKAWADKRIYIVVDAEMEDVAGNNFQDLLDHSIETETNLISNITIPVDLISRRR